MVHLHLTGFALAERHYMKEATPADLLPQLLPHFARAGIAPDEAVVLRAVRISRSVPKTLKEAGREHGHTAVQAPQSFRRMRRKKAFKGADTVHLLQNCDALRLAVVNEEAL